MGSSFLPGELTAAFLLAQLEEAERITNDRLAIWEFYHYLLEPLEQQGVLRRPIVPDDCQHNAHMYYVLLSPEIDRQMVINELKQNNIFSVFHYVPLHNSPAGIRYGRAHGKLDVTLKQSDCLLRLPIWVGLSMEQQSKIKSVLQSAITKIS